MRIAILDKNDNILSFIDNDVHNALHYYDDVLHTYLKGSNFTFEFTTFTKHEDSKYLVVGNKLSFVYEEKQYYTNIVNVEKNEFTVKVQSYGLVFELLNEIVPSYDGTAKTFVDHLNNFGFVRDFYKIKINEISSKSLAYKAESEETVLSRIFSLASTFESEIEFITKLKRNYQLDYIEINIYKQHDSSNQGMGRDKSNTILRYGKEIKGISKTTDISELITSVKPIGDNNINISKLELRENDAKGKLLYYSPLNDHKIYAVQSVELFPSNLASNDKYINAIFTVNSNNANVVLKEGLEHLKANCVPKVSYKVDGYIDANIGDTYTIEDDSFDASLYLRARVTEQQISTTDSSKNVTVFDNFEERQSQLSQNLINEIKKFTKDIESTISLTITSDKGTVFSDLNDNVTLTAHVFKGKNEIEIADDGSCAEGNIRWFKNNIYMKNAKSITISSEEVSKTAAYSCYLED